jgi:hypothetical protein
MFKEQLTKHQAIIFENLEVSFGCMGSPDRKGQFLPSLFQSTNLVNAIENQENFGFSSRDDSSIWRGLDILTAGRGGLCTMLNETCF